MKRATIAFIVLMVSGCASGGHHGNSAQNSATVRNHPAFCEVATEMTWAASDSIDTQAEIRAHNANWKKFCRPEGPPNGKH